MAIELVIFDFDGTIVDTAPDLIRAANLYLESKGHDALPESFIRSHIGMGLRRLILDVFPDEGKDDIFRRKIEGEFLAVYEREYLHSPTIFPGLTEFLAEYDGKVAIVSNKRARFILPILQKLGIAYPWVKIIGGDTYPNMKPHPEPFLGAIQAVGCTPEETLIVGDGSPDVQGALAIGSLCVAVEHGYEPVDDLMSQGAYAQIESFHELLPLIRKIT